MTTGNQMVIKCMLTNFPSSKLCPTNLLTGKRYRGNNRLHLENIINEFHFSSPYFLTKRQIITLGGYIKQGNEGFHIDKWIPAENITIGYTVFNLDQVAGLGKAQKKLIHQVIIPYRPMI